MKTTIGGDRLGSGNKQEVSLRNYSRSTHDLGYIWRSSMSSGTLVPFLNEVGLPGDSFDIKLDCDVKTLPTVGPLFGSYKVQLDVFECPVRLFQGKLHMNMLNIGMDMSEVLLPQVELEAKYEPDGGDNSQINSSSLLSYLNIRGIGRTSNGLAGNVFRKFNAVPYLSVWEIYKNYYANKQEERGFVIHNANMDVNFDTVQCNVTVVGDSSVVTKDIFASDESINTDPDGDGDARISMEIIFKWNTTGDVAYGQPKIDDFVIDVGGTDFTPEELFASVQVPEVQAGGLTGEGITVRCGGYTGVRSTDDWDATGSTEVGNTDPAGAGQPQLTEFPLSNIDDMKMDILKAVSDVTAFRVSKQSDAPYGLGLGAPGGDLTKAYKLASQEGLPIKTYQSDLFNNWISTEWIDGTNGINEVTAVSTAGNEFTIDALNLANKVYVMLNRIAISGGSYDDWLDAVYTHERSKSVESPVYHGSLIKELAFEEVVSMSDVQVAGEEQPLGTLAGRGRLTGKDKGGNIRIKVSEPSVIIGLVSITPRIDYSQGNKWDVNLKTMNDFHKPQLDAIGYQSLITDQMAWFDTECDALGNVTYSSAGKQPAWINYMTNVNQTRGNFAVQVGEERGQGEMFMTLNRRYEQGTGGIEDLTTYIDPSKYNNIFAQTQRDSQNFWVQISNRITARRKMSAKVIPNL
jgi:hypothetical protein